MNWEVMGELQKLPLNNWEYAGWKEVWVDSGEEQTGIQEFEGVLGVMVVL